MTQKPKVLVVDDGTMNRNAAEMILKVNGFDVVQAEDGMKALTKLQAGGFALVFSDIEMPNMNGFELLGRIKRDPNLAKIPVIMCTTLNSPEVVDKLKKLGASFHIVKPFTTAAVQSALKAAGLKP